jgi:hypothetical protein
MTDPPPARQDEWAATFRENVLLLRLSIYGGGMAVLAGMLAAVFLPLGHPLAVWLTVTGVACAALGLTSGAYVARRGRS